VNLSASFVTLRGKILNHKGTQRFSQRDTKDYSKSLFLHKLNNMQVFYAPEITGEYYTLDERESKHTVRVLRMSNGSEIRLIDGKGNLYEGIISEPDQKACKIRVLNIIKGFEKRDYRIHIAISQLKNPERFEWFVEKSVEIGVDEITPLICSKTEKQGLKHERLNNIIISAMKQSLKANSTKLNVSCKFNDFINSSHPGILMIAHCNDGDERKSIDEVYTKGNEAVILIGPEGDFSEDEISNARKNGYVPVHLGKSRLRTETAGVAACHSFYFINQ
jgi:16S rRNA (uracil1498-N3)-methyltransferase